MNRSICLAPFAAFLLSALPVSAAGPKTYQVTGPILELTDTVITIQKGDDKWEIARTPDTKVTGTLKVGEKVTIVYTMSANKIEVK